MPGGRDGNPGRIDMNRTPQFLGTPGGRTLLGLVAAFAVVQVAGTLSSQIDTFLAREFGLRTLRLHAALLNPAPAETLAALATLATYAFLHGGWLHVLFNSLLLAGLGLPVAAVLGGTRFLMFFLGTAIGAGIAHTAWHWSEPSIAVGASGAVFGAAAARAWLTAAMRNLPVPARRRYLLRQAGSWMLVNALIWLAGTLYADASGSGIAIAWAAHAGGYAAGALLAPPFFSAAADARQR